MGIVVMFIGYVLFVILIFDNFGKIMMFGVLVLIVCGIGFFKGNLQVMVGNLYDVFEYSFKCDIVFSIFYMVINIGVMYVLIVVMKVINYMLGKVGLLYVFQIFLLVY